MAITFNSSQTKINLMRAFAGESQARNRYNVRRFTGENSKAARHRSDFFLYRQIRKKNMGEIFYQHLAQLCWRDDSHRWRLSGKSYRFCIAASSLCTAE